MIVLIASDDFLFEQKLQGKRVEISLFQRSLLFVQVNHQWNLKLSRGFQYLKKNSILEGNEIQIQYMQTKKICTMYFYSDNQGIYTKFQWKDVILIGPEKKADLSFFETIRIDTNQHLIQTQSKQTAINGKPFVSAVFHEGDVLLARNLCIVFGPDFIMIRDGMWHCSLDSYVQQPYRNPLPIMIWQMEHRQPVIPLVQEIDLKEPSRLEPMHQMNLLTMMLPSIMMLSSTFCIGLFNAYRSYMNGKEMIDILPSVLMPGMMLASTVISHPLVVHIQKRKWYKQKKKREIAYQKELDQSYTEILSAQREHFFCLNEEYPSTKRLLYTVAQHCLPEQRDQLLAGWRQEQLNLEISEKETQEADPCITEMQRDFRKKIQRQIMTPFFLPMDQKIRIEGENAEKLFLSLLIQAGMYRKDCVLVAEQEWLNQFPFLLQLPGLFGKDRRRIFRMDEQVEYNGMLVFRAVSKEKMYEIECDTGQTDEALIDSGEESYYYHQAEHQKINFLPNLFDGVFPSVNLKTEPQDPRINPSFLDLYHVSYTKDLNVKERWNQCSDSRSRTAIIGLDEKGESILLDLSEEKNGPHGLIAGTTGSGKSELILTMLLSLMVNYSPQDVQIAFIDFKGGSALNAFEVEGKLLPHIVGTMSNLDLHNTERVLYALKNECILRQKRFREAGLQYHVSIMNLYDYRILQGKQKELPPMADLFLIVDEFAELKAQSYEMLNQLISISRIGRSLGIHLILSTQKPAGVVNDQIWSNSRFKICLKVSEKQDSIEILHSPDAIELKQPGQFILECDGTRRKGICGYSGYRKSRQKLTLHILDSDGRKIDDYASYGEFAEPQILEVCREIDNAGKECRVQKLWLDPIKKCHWQQLLKEKAFGIIDDYYTQKQPYCVFHYDAHSHLAILTSDLYVRNGVIRYFKFLLEKEFHEINVYETEEILNQSSFNPAVFCSNQKKVVIVNDTGRFYEQAAKYRIHELLEHSQEYNIQFIFFLSQSSAMPYHDQNLIGQKICMKNDNAEEISTFLGVRVKRTLKEKDGGLIVWNHLLEIRMGYVE
jgi:hypothetical protein